MIVRNLMRKMCWWKTRKNVVAHRMPDSTTKQIFVGLSGPEVSQEEPVIQMSSGYECWNLKKFTLDGFISALQAKIPPINENVLNNYRAAEDNSNPDHGLKP